MWRQSRENQPEEESCGYATLLEVADFYQCRFHNYYPLAPDGRFWVTHDMPRLLTLIVELLKKTSMEIGVMETFVFKFQYSIERHFLRRSYNLQ